jgi:c(7)-type cytochrome triheme protein
MAPAVFDHWRHRAVFSCRLCHIDVGFAMQAGASGIARASNAAGLHCGACHDGKRTLGGKTVFAACTLAGPAKPGESCARCHADGGRDRARAEYLALSDRLPTYGGGYIDWERAEERALVKPIDLLEGVSIVRPAMKLDRDVPIEVKGSWIGGVTFSHRKHAVWNGCEVCHPEIFPVTKAGSVRFSMADVRAGRYCGACHRSVAFPLSLCQRCHRRGPFGG